MVADHRWDPNNQALSHCLFDFRHGKNTSKKHHVESPSNLLFAIFSTKCIEHILPLKQTDHEMIYNKLQSMTPEHRTSIYLSPFTCASIVKLYHFWSSTSTGENTGPFRLEAPNNGATLCHCWLFIKANLAHWNRATGEKMNQKINFLIIWLALSREWGNQPLHWYIGDSFPHSLLRTS